MTSRLNISHGRTQSESLDSITHHYGEFCWSDGRTLGRQEHLPTHIKQPTSQPASQPTYHPPTYLEQEAPVQAWTPGIWTTASTSISTSTTIINMTTIIQRQQQHEDRTTRTRQRRHDNDTTGTRQQLDSDRTAT
ncbi:hypothetical protein LA080_001879 [Diaporthe eres]|nr:hypothetical protein LA080_001879 [Diaporthe eres]